MALHKHTVLIYSVGLLRVLVVQCSEIHVSMLGEHKGMSAEYFYIYKAQANVL